MAAYCSFGPATSTQHWSTLAERGWCERLVDIASPDSPLQLRLVLSPGPTPASRLMVPRRLDGMPLKQRNLFKQLEVSPQVGGGQDCHLAGSLGCAGRGLGQVRGLGLGAGLEVHTGHQQCGSGQPSSQDLQLGRMAHTRRQGHPYTHPFAHLLRSAWPLRRRWRGGWRSMEGRR